MIELGKQYRTRDGRKVRIFATDGGGSSPILGAILDNNKWSLCRWMENGHFIANETWGGDLVEVRPRHKRTVWLNVYENNPNGSYYEYKRNADVCPTAHSRIACIPIELDYEEGEGL